jgi:hypothetical protein
MIKVQKDERVDMYPYFYTIEQNIDKLEELINTYESNDCYFHYEPDQSEGYSDGTVSIYYMDTNQDRFNYHISLSSNNMSGSYCDCSSSDKEYNPIHNCCGIHCDSYTPSFNVSKTKNVAHGTFLGLERDLWRLEEEWNKEIGINENEHILEQINFIDGQIEELIKRKNAISKSL